LRRPRATAALALVLGLGAAACSSNGTGVLLTINGSGVTADQLTITANYSGRSITHSVPGTVRPLTFPTTVVVALPDEPTSVILSVTALSGSSAVAGGATGALAVAPHKLVQATVELNAGTIPPDGGVTGGDGGSGPTCGQIAVLVDEFAAGAGDPLFLPYAFGGETITPTGGTLAITFPASESNGNEAGYPSQAYYDATGSSVTIDVPQMVDTSTNAYAGLSINRDNHDFLEISQESGSLNLDDMENGTRNRLTSIPYSATDHRWWRIRESADTVFFETAPDGTTWTARAMVATPSWTSYAFVNIFAGVDGNVANGGEVHFDQLNHGSATGVRCPASSLSDDFADGVRGDQWLPSTSSHCTMTENGQLEFGLSPAPSSCEYISSYSYDLTGSSVIVEVPTAPTKADGAVSWLRAVTDETNESGYEIGVDEGTLQFVRVNSDGSGATEVTTTFDPVAHRWWRIREAGGQIVYETAPDGKTWTMHDSEPVSYPVTAMRTHLGVSVYDQAATAPGHVDFAHLNIPPQ
jgi:hypothetical protein